MSKEVLVIGAGFSGLVASWRLQKDGFKVTVVEKSDRAGGLIATARNGFGLVETAANGLLSSQLVEELFRDCGLKIQVPKKNAKRRYMAVDGKLSRWPLSAFETVRLAIGVARIRVTSPKSGELLHDWAARAVGDKVATKLIGPAMLGVYAADSSLLSANLIVGRFFDKTKRRNVRGRIRGTVACEGGMGTLMQSLRSLLESRAVVFKLTTEGRTEIEKARSKKVPVVIATSAWEAAELIPSDVRHRSLSKVKSIPLATLTLFFTGAPLKRGFGTLFSQSQEVGEPDGILGCLQNSEIFSDRVTGNYHSETWILGGALTGTQMLNLTDDQIIHLVIAKRERWIDAHSRSKLASATITRWPRAIPLYSPELEKLVPELLKDTGGVVLFGNYLGDLGLASILESTRVLSERVRNL